MKGFFRRISPKRAVTDFADHWQQPTPHRWGFLGVAMASTFAVFMLVVNKSEPIVPAKPEIIYIATWEDGRTDAEIIASNCSNQLLKNELEAKLAERAELRKELYKALGRATFVDVDAIEAEAEAERAAQEAAGAQTEEEPQMTLEEYCASAAAS